MSCYGSGFIPILIYSLYEGGSGPSVYDDIVLEDSGGLFLEDGGSILTEGA